MSNESTIVSHKYDKPKRSRIEMYGIELTKITTYPSGIMIPLEKTVEIDIRERRNISFAYDTSVSINGELHKQDAKSLKGFITKISRLSIKR